MTFTEVADWGLQTGLVVSCLIGLVLIIRRPFARYFGAGAAYALWVLPALRLFMPTITVPFLRRPAPAVSVSEPAAYLLPNEVPQIFLERGDSAFTTVDPTVLTDGATGFPALSLSVILTAVWLGVAVIWFGFQLLQQGRFMARMKAHSDPVSHRLTKQIERSRGFVGLRRSPDIRLSPDVPGPMVTGVTHPMILLPQDFEARFNEEQQVFALVHEMAHIKRGDLWVALATLGFRALFWPNPLVHFAAHKMRIDQEAACDASVIAKTGGNEVTHSYAQTLVQAAKLTKQSGQKTPLGLALCESNPDMGISKGDENDEMV